MMTKSARLIDAVIIDTCVFHALNYDFSGQNNNTLPSFKTLLHDHEILFVSSSIIKSEVLTHVAKKAQEKELVINKLLSKHGDILPLIGLKNLDLVHKRVGKLDLISEYKKEVEDFFCNSHFLSIPRAEEIFEKYFNNSPPFSESGKKKAEFPDAFVIQSVLNYANEYNKEVLVVSSDDDWEKAFQNECWVTFVASVNDAIKYIHEVYSNRRIAELYSSLSLEETAILLSEELIDSTFYVDDFYSEVEDIDEVSMSAPLYDICPLSISNCKILYSAIAPIEITAKVIVLDESESIWDSEVKEFIITEYKSITVTSNIDVYFEAEVLINDDKSVTNRGAVSLKNVNNNKNIIIKLPINQY